MSDPDGFVSDDRSRADFDQAWVIPRPQRLGVPLVLAVVGVFVTVWNVSLLAVTTLS